MRVCQFRHYGTVFYAPHRRPEHANREPLVLQTPPPLSMQVGMAAGLWSRYRSGGRKYSKPSSLTGETSGKKRRLLEEKATFPKMTEQKNVLSQAPSNSEAPADAEKIPEDLSVEMRRIAHDLSNALEIIIQTSYLLSTTEMKAPASDWLRMLDEGVQKAMSLNLELRTYIKEHTSS
jgi:hypothetical protein